MVALKAYRENSKSGKDSKENIMTGIIGAIATALGLVRKADDSKTVQKILDGIDHLHLSDEEKIKYVIEQKKIMETGENSIRSVTRRILAVGIIGNFLILVDVAAVLYIVDADKKADSILKLALVLATAVTAVVIFYFGYYGLTKIVEKFKGGNNVTDA